jgi:hypothetical protein
MDRMTTAMDGIQITVDQTSESQRKNDWEEIQIANESCQNK